MAEYQTMEAHMDTRGRSLLIPTMQRCLHRKCSLDETFLPVIGPMHHKVQLSELVISGWIASQRLYFEMSP